MKLGSITKTLFKVSDFISWQKNSGLKLSPSFQRRSVWKPGAKSYLLDTIIRGLPIPIIFLRDRRTNLKTLQQIREVVDGQQRIRTLIAFISPDLLEDYKPERDFFQILPSHNKEFAKKSFNELPSDICQRILDYEFSTHVLPTTTGDREVLQIFARINSTGLRLKQQELRNAEYFGELKISVYDYALKQLTRWRDWKIFTEDNIARMDEVEFASELYYLMINGISGRSQQSLSAMYKTYDDTFNDRKEVESRFEHIMDCIEDNLGDKIRISVFKKKTLFYILFAILYDICFGVNSSLAHKTPKRITQKQLNKLIEISDLFDSDELDEEVREAATRRTTNVKERRILFSFIRKQL